MNPRDIEKDTRKFKSDFNKKCSKPIPDSPESKPFDLSELEHLPKFEHFVVPKYEPIHYVVPKLEPIQFKPIDPPKLNILPTLNLSEETLNFLEKISREAREARVAKSSEEFFKLFK